MRRIPTVVVIGALLAAALVVVLVLNRGGDTPQDNVSGPSSTAGPSGTSGTPAPTPQPDPTPPSYEPEFSAVNCRFDEPTGYSPRCGWVTVPEDRSVDNGREVRLHIAVFESETAADDATPVVYLAGGPGGATLDALFFTFEDVWSPLLEHGDVVFFDQRGVGLSQPTLDCPEERRASLEVLDEVLTADEAVAVALDSIQICRDRLVADGVDLAAYDSAANAADVNDIRRALGYEQWDLLGISYGTRLAQTVVRDHPNGVRSVILDSTYPIEANLLSETPANLDRALDNFFSSCSGDVECAEEYPGLRARAFALVEALEADPLEVGVIDPIVGESYDAVLTGTGFLGVVFQSLYSDEFYSLLPEMIEELEKRQTTIVSALISNALANNNFFSLGFHLSVQCSEEVPFTTAADLSDGVAPYPELAELFEYTFNLSDAMFALCDTWGVESSGALENEAVTSTIPTMVMAGSFDPITPPRWGEAVAANFPNSTFVEFPTLGHGVSIASECSMSVTLDFLADPTGEVDTSCIPFMERVQYVEEPFDPSTIVLELFEANTVGGRIGGVFPVGWEEVAPGSWARGASSLDRTELAQQAFPSLGISDELLLGLIGDQVGIDSDFVVDRELDTGRAVWTIHTATFDAYTIDIALSDQGDSLSAVIMVSETEERAALFQVVLLPVLDAFVIT